MEAVKAIVKIDTETSLEPLIKATHDNDSEVQIRATDGIINFYLPGYIAKSGLSGSLSAWSAPGEIFLFDAQRSGHRSRHNGSSGCRSGARRRSTRRREHGCSHQCSSSQPEFCARSLLHPLSLRRSIRRTAGLIFESLVALQKIHDLSTGRSVAFLARDFDDRVQATAIETIGVLHSLDSAPDVRAALADARNAKIRRAALETLAMLAIPGDRATFQQYATDSDADLRASALEGLGRIRNPEDYPTLEQAYNEKDADWKVHLAAAFALVSEGKVETSDFSPLAYLMENLEVKGHANVATAYLTELARSEDVRQALFPLVPAASRDQKIALCLDPCRRARVTMSSRC